MATIQDLLDKIPGAFTIPEIEAYGDDGIVYNISDMGTTKLGEDKEEKVTISFEEVAKVLVINKTRGQQLADLFGAAVDCTGEKVKLVVRADTPVGSKKMKMINIEEDRASTAAVR